MTFRHPAKYEHHHASCFQNTVMRLPSTTLAMDFDERGDSDTGGFAVLPHVLCMLP
jgi:hypothetical protein